MKKRNNDSVGLAVDITHYSFDRHLIQMWQAITEEALKETLKQLEERHSDEALRQAKWAVRSLANGAAVGLRMWLLRSTHNETVTLSLTVPRTWWDHLKHDTLNGETENPWRRFFRVLIKRLSPPRYRTETQKVETVVRVCPHNDYYLSESQKHFEFLTYGDKSDEWGK